ncbi:MAG: reverse transcriptase family protein [Gemmataceae bacterium]|nr:reverse transcriptase family protein [Gemmataceae bacterium]
MAQSARGRFVANLAAALVAGRWDRRVMRAAAAAAVGGKPGWLAPLVRRVHAAYPEKPQFDPVRAFLERDPTLGRVIDRDGPPAVVRVFVPPAEMLPPPTAAGLVELPQLPTEAALAEWLGITPARLLWLADASGRNRKHPPGPLRTYHHRWVPKPGGRARLLEVPVHLLKEVQRDLLERLLDRIPPHPAAHGFRPGRSVVTNARPHCGRSVVIRFDLQDFFPSVSAARVRAIFRTFGYPEAVARLLTGLCTTRLPADVWDARPNPAADGSDHPAWQRLAARHLPQGAPTSPALANLAAFKHDRRLSKLAAALGADYTRYADDLTFSGSVELARGAKRLATLVAVIAGQEGFAVNHRKTRVMRRAGRQEVAGVVVNARPNVRRAEYDEIKAILTNCVRHGPAGQNRANHPDFRAHLTGRVAHLAAVHPAHGRKLWALLVRIEWRAAKVAGGEQAETATDNNR